MPIWDLLNRKNYVSSGVRRRRLAECNKCDELTKMRQCRDCGCFVDLKSKLRTENCTNWKK